MTICTDVLVFNVLCLCSQYSLSSFMLIVLVWVFLKLIILIDISCISLYTFIYFSFNFYTHSLLSDLVNFYWVCRENPYV